ncbi:MAG TPA: molybdenum cofactor biosynthesis protein MoaE [Candidatus Udaeobacter sp.]|jgi:molybdopterin synthase catalytic subunit|nr:molybdenum cofactor biosynthesis protein MoaE [Candidatus Udaeobacter sp.]
MANPVCEVLVTEARLNVLDNPMDPASGAIVDFQGVVRGCENGEEINGIRYEAHREMAEHQLKQIAERASILFGLRFVSIHHRIGFVAVGQVSLFMRVCSGHREAAFRASQWIVDELKKKVPIWKRPEFKSKHLPRSSHGEPAIAT